MPKRHAYNFKSLQGSSSTSNKSYGRDGTEKAPQSVNDRLNESRRLVGSNATAKKRELAELASLQRSVPPALLHGILGVAQSIPPKPRQGARTRTGTRATPGPPAPRSWTDRSTGLTPAERKGTLTQRGRSAKDRGPAELLRFARMTAIKPRISENSVPTLAHLALKCAAQHWHLLDEADLPSITEELPISLRLFLLSYLGFYGLSINITHFDALTRGAEVTVMDLTRLIGHGGLTLPRLSKLFKDESVLPVDRRASEPIVESWDQELFLEASLPSAPRVSRFSNITHASLSHPPRDILWRDLLVFARYIPNVTHLSLAYWPRPTLTPNMVTTTIDSPDRREVRAGGTSLYSGLDQDFAEPSALLRQLSNALLCLQWLDLEGCVDWMPALADTARAIAQDAFGADPIPGDQWNSSSFGESFLLHSWKNLTYINVAQGWHPDLGPMLSLSSPETEGQMHKSITNDYTRWLRSTMMEHEEGVPRHNEAAQDTYKVEHRKAHIWVSHEVNTTQAGLVINRMRRLHGCSLITFDHGWTRYVGSSKPDM